MCIAFSASISLSTSKCLHTNTRDLRREFDPSLIVPHRYLEPDRRLHFAASSTVIEEDVHGTMVGVRHNHADRSILSCASEDVEHFYDALHKLDNALENHTSNLDRYRCDHTMTIQKLHDLADQFPYALVFVLDRSRGKMFVQYL